MAISDKLLRAKTISEVKPLADEINQMIVYSDFTALKELVEQSETIENRSPLVNIWISIIKDYLKKHGQL